MGGVRHASRVHIGVCGAPGCSSVHIDLFDAEGACFASAQLEPERAIDAAGQLVLICEGYEDAATLAMAVPHMRILCAR